MTDELRNYKKELLEEISDEFKEISVNKLFAYSDIEFIMTLIEKHFDKYANAYLDEVLKEIVPNKAIPDDDPLPINANDTQIYNKEAQCNMADGFNFCRDEILVRAEKWKNRTGQV